MRIVLLSSINSLIILLAVSSFDTGYGVLLGSLDRAASLRNAGENLDYFEEDQLDSGYLTGGESESFELVDEDVPDEESMLEEADDEISFLEDDEEDDLSLLEADDAPFGDEEDEVSFLQAEGGEGEEGQAAPHAEGGAHEEVVNPYHHLEGEDDVYDINDYGFLQLADEDMLFANDEEDDEGFEGGNVDMVLHYQPAGEADDDADQIEPDNMTYQPINSHPRPEGPLPLEDTDVGDVDLPVGGEGELEGEAVGDFNEVPEVPAVPEFADDGEDGGDDEGLVIQTKAGLGKVAVVVAVVVLALILLVVGVLYYRPQFVAELKDKVAGLYNRLTGRGAELPVAEEQEPLTGRKGRGLRG
ncbi:hypothetical protein BgAZ_305920 [Babesia gibsoni]|uniref:Uncharacterized protein n=1 Tax=Babesia gibsoni TaxID=33632 RepID=A0AAD8PDN7_BABGI|nr:hypothetical protein BgAZ_305920 [Babesia gibsoni]